MRPSIWATSVSGPGDGKAGPLPNCARFVEMRTKRLWATILAQVGKSDACDGLLSDLLLDIIRDYLKRPSDEEIVSMWLATETGSGDDPDELLADSVRLGLEMELLAEVTRVAWKETRPPKNRKKR
jgi:hypothetical protein